MAPNKSKNSRVSAVATGKFQISGDAALIISLNHGKHAYVTNVTNGKIVHAATSSAAFDQAIAAIVAEGMEARIRTDLDRLAERFPKQPWGAITQRLVAAGVLA